MKHKTHSPSWKQYLPLLTILTLIASVAGITSGGDGTSFLLHSMIGVFLVFGGFKLIDLQGFAEGYALYNVLAQRWRGYGYLYPFLEVGLGLVMLAGFHPHWLLLATATLMLFNGGSAAIAMRTQTGVECVCLGTVLKVPLTFVTLVEDVGMATLALLLLL